MGRTADHRCFSEQDTIRLIRLHDGLGKLVHKTKNPYATDGRDFLFFSALVKNYKKWLVIKQKASLGRHTVYVVYLTSFLI